MRAARLFPLVLLLVAGCRSTAPPDTGVAVGPEVGVMPEAPSSVIETPEALPPAVGPSAVAPEADFLYEEPESDLRQRFQDGLRGLHGADVAPQTIRTLRGDDVEAWLDALAAFNPDAAQYALDVLGEVLDQRFVTAFVAEDPAPAECAQTSEVLYVAVPTRFQVAGRRLDGLLVRDACEVGFNEMCLTCSGGSGTSASGAVCSCTCAISACPTVECAACSE